MVPSHTVYHIMALNVVPVLISCVFLVLLVLLLVVLLVVYGLQPPEDLAVLLHHLLLASLTQGHHMDRQARAGDTVLFNSREMTSCSGWGLEG